MLTKKRISFHSFQKAIHKLFLKILFKRKKKKKHGSTLGNNKETTTGIVFLMQRMSVRNCDFQYIIKLFRKM